MKIFEVGARDGLQNERKKVPTAVKRRFVEGLVEAGIKDLELGAFVRRDRVPQMADSDLLFGKPPKLKGARPWALVPNLKGLERAHAAGVKHIAIFTTATEGFAQANIGMSIKDSLKTYQEVVEVARSYKMKVRGYVSTAFGCPFEGKVSPRKALRVIEALGGLGVEEVSIGDTIGVATPKEISAVVPSALKALGHKKVALHLHDTRGTALANVLRGMDLGVTTFDASAGGLGGCPFAPGAAGNLATEDLVYMLQGMGIRTGVDLDRLSLLSIKMAKYLGRPVASRYVMAFAKGRSKTKRR